MEKPFDISAKLKSETGVTAVYVAIMLVVFIGMIALAVDVGYMMVAKNESQNAADAAALAGARRLGENYYVSASPVTTDVTTVAQNTASQNKVAGQNLAADNIDIQIGIWEPPFNGASTDPPNAVWAEVKREETLTNGAINTFFARVFGINNYKMAATACAALSGICTETPGIPLGIGRSWFTSIGANNGCTQIAVNKTTESCAGWTNLSTAKFRHADVQAMLQDMTKIPKVKAGDMVQFGGGTIDPVIDDLKALFDKMATGTPPTWTTAVVVFEDFNNCSNPVELSKILGFATVKITNIITTGSNKGIEGVVQCNIVEDERGGCFYAGTYGVIPGLVK
jgi:hypothetical protein